MQLGMDKKPLLENAVDLDRHLHKRHVPMERGERKSVVKHLYRQVLHEAGFEKLSDLGITQFICHEISSKSIEAKIRLLDNIPRGLEK